MAKFHGMPKPPGGIPVLLGLTRSTRIRDRDQQETKSLGPMMQNEVV